MNIHRSTAPDKAFNSLDVQRAVAFGWETHRGVSQNEMRVLTFIASRGTRSEPRHAFSWFPIGGQNWWAAMMAMPHSSLRKALMNLRKKGLLRDLAGASKDSRFAGVRGYGIPDEVLSECRKWWQSRQDMVYTKVPDTPEQMFDYVPSTEQVCSADGTSLFPQGTSDPPQSLSPGQVSALYQWSNQRVTNLLTESARPPGVRCSTSQEPFMRYEDEWSLSKEDRGRAPSRRPAPDSWEEPKEALQPRTTPKRPAGRLADLFDDLWKEARETHLMLSNKWNTKAAFCTRLNGFLKEYSEAEIAEMMRIFFRLLGSSRISLRSDELWKDFWNNRSTCLSVLREQASMEIIVDEAAELRKLERIRAKTR